LKPINNINHTPHLNACSGNCTCHPGSPSMTGENLLSSLTRKWAWPTRMLTALLLLGTGLLIYAPYPISTVLFLASYLCAGGDILYRALHNLSRGQWLDENSLMSIATVGALLIGEYPEAVAVMLFYQVGMALEERAVNRSRGSIKELLDIRPSYANLLRGNREKQVHPREVKSGERILVKPGERIPLDGVVRKGSSLVDTSALTGEPSPRQVRNGSEVIGGYINQEGLLTVEVTRELPFSLVSRILELVENAAAQKAPAENFITRFARYYTPAVVAAAAALALLPPLLLSGASLSEWVYRALVFLVISCPCALVISIPLSFFGGIGGASRSGILVKGSNYLESLNRADTVIFDKTGTLTRGVFQVTEIKPVNGFSKGELLELAAMAESNSRHPVAVSIREAYGKEKPGGDQIERFQELAGRGVKAETSTRAILCGNHRLLQEQGISAPEIDSLGTVVHLAVDRIYAGHLVVSDEIKEDTPRALRDLKEAGVKNTIMLTGDTRETAEGVARKLGIDRVYAGMLPHHKVKKMEELTEANRQANHPGNLVFVGDGINDAPVLARADVGVAMGGLGSDAAIEAAHVVIMNDQPSRLARGMKIARKTQRIVWQNIFLALGVKGVVLLLGAFGLAAMWEAIFADVGVTLLAVLNSMRAMKP